MSTPSTELEIDDAVVLLLGAPSKIKSMRGRIEGITRLEKLVFLLERETGAADWLTESGDFVAYNFGPFSSKVYRAVDMLSTAEIITDSKETADTDEDSWEQRNIIGGRVDDDRYVTRDFELTDRGWRYFDSLKAALPLGALEELTRFKEQFATLPLRQLVRYVYTRYEDYTDRSLIRDEVLGS